MKPGCNVASLVERFFTERLVRQQDVSVHTIASYRDTFRLLLKFAMAKLRKAPSALTLDELDAPFIGAFLTDLEMERGTSVTTRNLRLTAVRSFFRFVSFEEPAHSALIQRVLAIPSKRQFRDRSRPRCARSDDVARPARSHIAAARDPDRLAPLRTDRLEQRSHSSRYRCACAVCGQGPQGAMYPIDKIRPDRASGVAQ